MLCDQISDLVADKARFSALHPIWGDGTAIGVINERIDRAARFFLDRKATIFIHTLQDMPMSRFLDAFQMCKLPYSPMWVEFEFSHRLAWLEEARRENLVKIRDHAASIPPVHLGFLIEEGEEEGIITVQPVWNHRKPFKNDTAHSHIDVSMKIFEIDTRKLPPVELTDTMIDSYLVDASKGGSWNHGWAKDRKEILSFYDINRRIRYKSANYMLPFWERAMSDPVAFKFADDAANYDLASEWRFVCCLLMVLNSRNIISEGAEEKYEKLNRARARLKKPPLRSIRPITISLHMQKQISREKSGDEYRDIIRHSVRGHFKLRKTTSGPRLLWWHTHERGSIDKGAIKPRNYNVKG